MKGKKVRRLREWSYMACGCVAWHGGGDADAASHVLCEGFKLEIDI